MNFKNIYAFVILFSLVSCGVDTTPFEGKYDLIVGYPNAYEDPTINSDYWIKLLNHKKAEVGYLSNKKSHIAIVDYNIEEINNNAKEYLYLTNLDYYDNSIIYSISFSELDDGYDCDDQNIQQYAFEAKGINEVGDSKVNNYLALFQFDSKKDSKIKNCTVFIRNIHDCSCGVIVDPETEETIGSEGIITYTFACQNL